MSRPTKDASCWLIVEGHSDLRFYAELLEHLKIGGGAAGTAVYIHQCNGYADVMKQIEVLVNDQLLAEKAAVGVILDADDNPAGRREALAALLNRLCGAKLNTTGGWSNSRLRSKVGFFVVPGDTANAVDEIETLAWRAWAEDGANKIARACIENFLDCMKGDERTPKNLDKARIGALLAILNDEDPRLGPGAQKRLFDFDRAEFAPLRSFLDGFRTAAP